MKDLWILAKDKGKVLDSCHPLDIINLQPGHGPLKFTITNVARRFINVVSADERNLGSSIIGKERNLEQVLHQQPCNTLLARTCSPFL